ncbi:hypothetical protein TNCV_2515741 [Trichonephila clavipes]|nr:hypothetical protein TNCV_2515741 [Trichonephila clavipes]
MKHNFAEQTLIKTNYSKTDILYSQPYIPFYYYFFKKKEANPSSITNTSSHRAKLAAPKQNINIHATLPTPREINRRFPLSLFDPFEETNRISFFQFFAFTALDKASTNHLSSATSKEKTSLG